MRRILLLALCFAATAFGQAYTPPAEDAQFGIMSVPCSNSNTAFKIDSSTYPLFPLFCTPSGHAMAPRGFYVMDYNLEADPDESGTSGQTFAFNKYGGSTNAFTQAAKTVVFWGMNSLPPFENVNLKAPANPVTKIPFVALMLTSEYCMVNKLNWGGTGSGCKDFFYYLGGSGGTTTWGGFHNSTGMADWRDPNFLAVFNGILANDGGMTALAATSAANKAFLLGISPDESDGLHGMGAGPDFATQPPGNNDFALGYVAFFIPPVSYANSHQAQIYATSSEVFMKFRFQTLTLAAHGGTIGGINAAWGSTYTTKDSSGTCIGSQPVTCASSLGAESYGTGTGVQLTFSHTLANTAVSKYSVGVFVAGVLVGGDTGAGAFYGPNLSGAINYSTGVSNIAFTSGHAPANGAAITVNYIQNGWGIGTGFMDEDCRAGHSAYCGTGAASVTVNLTGIPAAVQTDINALTQDSAQFYASTTKSAMCTWAAGHGFTGCPLNFGGTTAGTWSTPSSRYVLAGLLAGGQDVYSYGGQANFSQAEIDFMDTWAHGMPIIAGSYRTANADSPYSWKGTATKSGITASMTVASPLNLTASSLMDITCTDTTYNKIQGHATSVVGTTITWTPSPGPPSSASTACNAFWDDNNVGGFPSQAARAADFQTKIGGLPAQTTTAGGVHINVGYFWWQFTDNQAENLNWGPLTNRNNIYNPTEPVNAVVTCLAPNAAFNCGGELRGPYGGGTVAAIEAVNTIWDNALIAIPSGSVTSAPLSQNFGSINLNITSAPQAFTITNNSGSTITFTGNTLTTGTNFAIVGGSTCTGTLGNGGTCSISATFKPISLGVLSDTLNLAYTGASGSPVTIALSGTGLAIPAPCVQCILGSNLLLNGEVLLR